VASVASNLNASSADLLTMLRAPNSACRVSVVALAKLFHAIVVLGAGAAACAGHTERGEASGAGGSEPVAPLISLGGFPSAEEPDGVFWPTSCEFRYQYACDLYSPLQGCRCDASRPRSSADCGGAPRTSCATELCAPGESCDDRWVECQCREGAPLSASDCDGPGQFVCARYAPEFRDCHCDAARPKTLADCKQPEDFACLWVDGEAFADCACQSGDLPEDCAMLGCEFRCQSRTPRFGCNCFCGGIR
jgi:hypothetical protein